MIGTIRKHSKWLWILIAGLTIISFVMFMGSGPMKGGGGARGSGGYGTIYGKPVTEQDYARAQAGYFIYHWLRAGQWPDKAGVSREEMEREIYIRAMLAKKAASLGVQISDDALVTAASDFLRTIGRNGQSVRMQDFVQQALAPEGLGVLDLQNFLRDELTVQQLIQTLGLSGAFVTPQEAGQIYDRENQEISAQAVFFSASNYLSQVSLVPSAIAQFYTNNMAAYREPDRVQVNYVFFDLTNFLAQSKAEWAKTNLEENVTGYYNQNAAQFADAKTPEEAKVKIREELIRMRAQVDARQTANEFVNVLNAMTPAKAENLAALAKQRNLTVRTTAPFNANFGPEEFSATRAFTKAAFELNTEVPLAGPISGADGFYVIALAGQIPSSIPPLNEIQARVTQDFQMEQAITLAQRAGTNFYYSLAVQMAAGNSFAQAAVAAGHSPLVLTPFSISSTAIPEIGEHASVNQIKQAAFTTPVGHVSNFTPDSDGGFVLFVHEMLPVDQAKKTAALPQFLDQVRRSRQSEAFNVWIMSEANRELQDTPFAKQMAGAPKQP